MKYLSRIIFMAVAALGFASCSEESDIVSPGGQEPGDMPVNITFSFVDKSHQTRSMVSGTENPVHTMQLVCFDANGLYLGIRNADVTSNGPGTNPPMYDTGIISGTVPQGTSRIHFIANRNLTVPLSFNVGTAEETVMQSVELSTGYKDETVEEDQEVCYWGYHKEDNAAAMNAWLQPAAGSNSSIVYMIRDRARIMLTYDATDAEYTVKEVKWLIHNGRDRGYLAPKSANWENYYGYSDKEGHETELISTAGINEYTTSGRYSLWTSATENEDGNFDVAYQSTGTYTNQPQFLFEDGNEDKDNVKVILKVTYTIDGTDKTVYHVLRLKKDDTLSGGVVTQVGERYPVVRNNTYYITCKHLSPYIAFYETLEDAVNGIEFMNADIEIDRSITEVNNDTYTLQILLPTQTTSIVLNTEGEHQMDFAFRMVSNVDQEGSTNPADFEVKWEDSQDFCTDPELTYNSETKQFEITTLVIAGKLTDQLQDEWIVVRHKASGLTRFIHVFVINQFRYQITPTLTRVGTTDRYKLSFKLPPTEHTQFLEDGVTPDPTEAIYPESLYPIDVMFTTSTLKAWSLDNENAAYGLFGVSIESTQNFTDQTTGNTYNLFNANAFESDAYTQVSSTNANQLQNWWYQPTYWDYWYTYSVKEYPTDGVVNIYLQDVRSSLHYDDINNNQDRILNVGLYLYVRYFGKIYAMTGRITG